MKTVCILTSGIGSRMGDYSKKINKSMLPIDNRPIISHIIKSFGKKNNYVIALGHKSETVKDYLDIAFKDFKITYVVVKNFHGKGTGPGKSLLECKKKIKKEFYFVPCDIFIKGKIKNNLKFSNSFLGSKCTKKEFSNYLNFLCKDKKILKLYDKTKNFNSDFKSWSGICYIKDYKTFWKSLKSKKTINGERQISNGIFGLIKAKNCEYSNINWVDLGSKLKYINFAKKFFKYDFSKKNEFIFFENQKVIKFFSNKDDTKYKFDKYLSNKKVFPNNLAYKNNYISYDFIKGKNYYDVLNKKNFLDLLIFCKKKLWKKSKNKKTIFYNSCKNFYFNKTIKRLNLYKKIYPNYDSIKFVNKTKLLSIDFLLKKLKWDTLFLGLPYFIHGDLQFDNIIKTKKSFKLIDWRGDFSGLYKYGDIYYDLSKLYGGMIINYKKIKENKFNFKINGSKLLINFESCKNFKEIESIFFNFLKKNNFSIEKVKIITALIFLNMAPLHTKPFSNLLFQYARLLLTKNFNLIK